jgi:hypothetical protein
MLEHFIEHQHLPRGPLILRDVGLFTDAEAPRAHIVLRQSRSHGVLQAIWSLADADRITPDAASRYFEKPTLVPMLMPMM